MLNSFSVRGYKGLADFNLDKLGNINFIVGDNNMGKTSVLEAIYDWASGVHLNPILQSVMMRNNLQSVYAYYLAEQIVTLGSLCENNEVNFSFSGIYDNKNIAFYHRINVNGLYLGNNSISNDFYEQDKRKLEDEYKNNVTKVAKWEISGNDGILEEYDITLPQLFVRAAQPNKFASYMNTMTHRNISLQNANYANLKRNGHIKEVVEELKKTFTEIEDIDMIPYPDGNPAPLSVKLKNGKYLPMYNFGDGFQKWFYIVSSVCLSNNNILCVDEIDSSLHPGAQGEFCKNIIEYSTSNNIQMFITTHNLEFLDTFLAEYDKFSMKNDGCEVRIITLKNKDGKRLVRNISGMEACRMRDKFKLELR